MKLPNITPTVKKASFASSSPKAVMPSVNAECVISKSGICVLIIDCYSSEGSREIKLYLLALLFVLLFILADFLVTKWKRKK